MPMNLGVTSLAMDRLHISSLKFYIVDLHCNQVDYICLLLSAYSIIITALSDYLSYNIQQAYLLNILHTIS